MKKKKGIDVATQMLNQKYSEPWMAVVVDPVRTISSGKVQIGNQTNSKRNQQKIF